MSIYCTLIFISNLFTFVPLISLSDIGELTLIPKIICQWDVKNIMTLPIKRITLVLKVTTYIIISITAHPTGLVTAYIIISITAHPTRLVTTYIIISITPHPTRLVTTYIIISITAHPTVTILQIMSVSTFITTVIPMILLSIQHYVIKFVSDLRQVGSLLWFPPPIKRTATI